MNRIDALKKEMKQIEDLEYLNEMKLTKELYVEKNKEKEELMKTITQLQNIIDQKKIIIEKYKKEIGYDLDVKQLTKLKKQVTKTPGYWDPCDCDRKFKTSKTDSVNNVIIYNCLICGHVSHYDLA